MQYTPGMAEIGLVGFDADDTLWRCEDDYRAAQGAFEHIIGAYVDLNDVRVLEHLYAAERENITTVFGYGVKGMALSMIETAIAITDARISAADLHQIVAIAKDMLQKPVELLPGVREAVAAIAARHPVVLITKGDLFHQEAKIRVSGLAELFGRIEIVSEKDIPTYTRLLAEFNLPAERFVMIGNSLRSDIAPVLALGGWAIHVPYHLTWEHERAELDAGHPRFQEVDAAPALPAAVARIAAA